ncbi:MAG TPA: delta-60 repeat domain-containing protein [Polyangiaceae bacterium]|nr:delta-60 repeat domain-containing protein [Polyangiaceae bacterium]
MTRRRSVIVLLGVSSALVLPAACFSSSNANQPPGPTCNGVKETGSVLLPCRDAGLPMDAAITPDGTLAPPDTDAGAGPVDAALPEASPIDAAVVPPPKLCPGTLAIDPTFGMQGVVLDPTYTDQLFDVGFQSTGKIIVSGDTFLTRYNPDGTIDPTFGQSGYVTLADQNYPESVTILPDDGILVAGGNTSGNGSMCLLGRLTPDGALDTTFGAGAGTNPCASLPAAFDIGFSGIVRRPNGSFVGAGTAYPVTVTDRDFAFIQYDSRGTPDKTFGTGGGAVTGFPTDSPLTAFTLQADGKIVAVGQGTVERGDMPPNLAVARLNVDGSLDPTFGTGGRVALNIPAAFGEPTSVAVQSTGGIVIATQAGTITDQFTVVRLTPTGQLDATFGTAGVASAGFFGDRDDAVALTLLADDSMLVGGRVGVASDDAGDTLAQFGLVHLLPSGALDTSFGTGGKLFTPFPTLDQGTEYATQKVQANGAVVSAGTGGILDDGGNVLIRPLLVRYACH